jgi:hypothetical protein
MGSRTIYYDDTNPKLEADSIGLEFSVDGKDYEIDLAEVNVLKLREALAPYIQAARRTGGGRSSNVVKFTGSGAHRRPAVERDQLKAMREWAWQHGFKCGKQGRIPRAVEDAYHNRNPQTGAPAANETAPRADGHTSTGGSDTGGNKEPRNTATMDEFKTLFQAWARQNSYKINKSGLSAPPVVAKFSREEAIYPPNVELPKAG